MTIFDRLMMHCRIIKSSIFKLSIADSSEDFDKFAMYYKIIGNNNGNYPYKLGLNTLADNHETFDREPTCGPGGLYFSDIKHIFEYMGYGNKVCILNIPNDAHIIKVDDKYKADKIYINEIMEINSDVIKYLVEHGADITIDNNNIIRYTVRNGYLEAIKCLVEHGADITADNNYAIRWAARHGHLEVVKYLAKHGADVTAVDNFAVCCAAEYGHLETVKYLAEHGADITADDNYAIRWAARNGHLKVVKYLVENGADVTAVNNFAIRRAAYCNHQKIIEYLAKHGAAL